MSKIIFYGGAGSVTGSNFMLEFSPSQSLGTTSTKLLVDCGLQQGMNEEDNWKDFAYDPASVSHLMITHAHIDHVGRIPFLVRKGFKGHIISTEATKALAEPLLRDALELMRHAEHRTHRVPLYDERDIDAAMKLWKTYNYHEKVSLPDGVELELLDAGHIFGSTMMQFSKNGKKIVVTGDLGGGNSPLLPPHDDLLDIDWLVMESVYGDRTRPEDKDRRQALEDIIEDTAKRGGTLLLPAFSTERTQDLLFEIRELMTDKKIPSMRVYVDSPLAEKITKAYLAAPQYFASDIRARVEGGEDIFAFPELTFVESPEESHALADKPNPKIILAGSGMGGGGRVGTHERYVLPDKNSTYLVTGYQAAGTPGRRLLEGEKKLQLWSHGKQEAVQVNCKVEAVFGYSAHMDGEALLEFANKASASGKLQEVFVVEGEPASASFLAQRIRDYLGTKAITPEAGDSVTIDF